MGLERVQVSHIEGVLLHRAHCQGLPSLFPLGLSHSLPSHITPTLGLEPRLRLHVILMFLKSTTYNCILHSEVVVNQREWMKRERGYGMGQRSSHYLLARAD